MTELAKLQSLNISYNQLTELPELLGNLIQLQLLDLSNNKLAKLPNSLCQLAQLSVLNLMNNQLDALPDKLGPLRKLHDLTLTNNRIKDLPVDCAKLSRLRQLALNDNPLNPELAAAYKQGLDAVKAYLRAKAEAQITLNEAKLILIGEGEVGKTCLMDALLGNEWQEHDTTHGIQIKPIKLTHPETKPKSPQRLGLRRTARLPPHSPVVLQRARRLSRRLEAARRTPAGLRQGMDQTGQAPRAERKDPRRRTHGGPQQRQPDIDRQELWDLFGRETVVDFFFVDSKPDAHGQRKGIEELKRAIARVAADLPEVGRSCRKVLPMSALRCKPKACPTYRSTKSSLSAAPRTWTMRSPASSSPFRTASVTSRITKTTRPARHRHPAPRLARHRHELRAG